MSTQPRPMSDLLLALAGPIVWAAHFFGLYLTEALLCSTTVPAIGAQVRWIGAGLTVVALAALVTAALRHRASLRLFTGGDSGAPAALSTLGSTLALVSVLAVIWTSLPLLLLPACAPGSG